MSTFLSPLKCLKMPRSHCFYFLQAEFLRNALQEELSMASQLEGPMDIGKKVMADVEELRMKTATYDQDSKEFHKVVQDLLGLEVKEASLKLTENPCWTECEDTKDLPIFNEYVARLS